MFWNLEYLGSTEVAVLDGGWNQWQTLNALDPVTYPIEAAQNTLPPATYAAVLQEHLNASGAYLQDVLKNFDPTKVVTLKGALGAVVADGDW